jgi:hypothetical protein
MKKFLPIIFFLSAFLLIISFIGFRIFADQLIVPYAVVFIAASALYLIMSAALSGTALSQKNLWILIILAVFIRIIFLSMAPVGSSDAYRYIWDGKVQAHGINPYQYTALDERLNFLHSATLPSAMNHAELKTIYFPFTQWIFFLCYEMSGEAIWGIKLALLLAECLTMTGLWLMLRRFGASPKFILLYALCPLPIIQFAVDAHIDAIGISLLICFFYFFFSQKRTAAYVLLGLSMSVKPVGLALLPALLVFEKGFAKKLTAVSIPLLIVGIQFVPYLFTSNPFEALFSFTKNWTFNGLIFETLDLYFRDNQVARTVCAGLFFLALVFLNMNRLQLNDVIYFSILGLMILSPVVHPWYICWIASLLPFLRHWSGIVYVAAASLTSFTVVHYVLTGIWVQYWTVLLVEYIPVFVLAYFEIRQGVSFSIRGIS